VNFIPTKIPDVLMIEPKVFSDERGFFMETYETQVFALAGLDIPFVQDNHSHSCLGTLRGLHYQIRQAQGKLIRVVAGEIFDVAVDIRRTSSTFGKWVGQVLSDRNKLQMWIPQGFAHGFLVITAWADVVYKATDYYAPEWERTILWNDPDLAIDWPFIQGQSPVLSLKDSQGTRLCEAVVFE
jgi:dTDP-4-dehydrorhamnose 3,5-epimerase